ncbi:MAG TPA: DUF3368 domain-containing protein [Thermoplasmata archaeon]|nr:DUF3368 domain-containing protein [Thermoplasmata archaeon]
MLKVVSNSSPLIHLAKIKKLDLLKDIFGRIFIPKAVYDESVVEGFKEANEIKKSEWIIVKEIKNEDLKKALSIYLDDGEAEAITLAIEEKADLILLDDYDAREVARKYGLNITGVIGILLKAKYMEKIRRVKPYLEKLREAGFWINDDLFLKILREIKE